jgi:hypothetical protein
MGAAALVVLVVLGIGPESAVTTERVDRIETNHYFDEQGRHVFDQRIFWTFDKHACRYQIVAWRLVKPEHNHYLTGKSFCFSDDQRFIRNVKAVSVFESWTQYDPELIERQFLDKEDRRELTRPPTRRYADYLLRSHQETMNANYYRSQNTD